jgi:hypothetical protein
MNIYRTTKSFQEQQLLKLSSSFLFGPNTCLALIFRKKVATYLIIKMGNKEEEKKSLKCKKKHFSQSYINMNHGLRIDILVKCNY